LLSDAMGRQEFLPDTSSDYSTGFQPPWGARAIAAGSTSRAARSICLEPSTDSNIDDVARAIVESRLPVEPLFSAIVEQALAKASGNYTHAAKRVGLTRAQLAYRA